MKTGPTANSRGTSGARCNTGSETPKSWALSPQLHWSLARIILLAVATFLLLRPVLLTNVGADDLLNPFSQLFHVGTNPTTVLRSSSRFVSVTGHFNYLGQAIGSLAVLSWTILIGQFGLHFNVIYAATKFLTYVIAIASSVWVVRLSCRAGEHRMSRTQGWVVVLLVLVIPLQIHIPWSNDPVASYPLSGFLTASLGVIFIGLAHSRLSSASWLQLTFVGLYGAGIVLYYEFNSFAIMSVLPLILHRLWTTRSTVRTVAVTLARAMLLVGPAAATTAYFFLRNRAGSAAYSGTEISLASPFPTTFRNALLSSLPGSSWGIGSDWLGSTPGIFGRHLLPFIAGLLLLAIAWRGQSVPSDHNPQVAGLSRQVYPSLVAGSLLIYWLGATFTQAATVKVQQEAVRIGQVYNYYAVGAMCFSLIVLVVLANVRLRQTLASVLVISVCVLGLGQYSFNSAVTEKYNAATAFTGVLLNSIDPEELNEERCTALDYWKSAGWPEYYWLDMELGLQRLGEVYWEQPFCTR